MDLAECRNKLKKWITSTHDWPRKYTGEPYYNHLFRVADRVSLTRDYTKQPALWEIAVCHDTVEDTGLGYGELWNKLEEIGYAPDWCNVIVIGVMHCTDVFDRTKCPQLNRGKRKKLECMRMSSIPSRIVTIRYADFLDNFKSISEHDEEFARLYAEEKKEMLSLVVGGDQRLKTECVAAIEKFEAGLL